MYSPIRHWGLVGEIVEVNFFIRPRVTIKTQYGETVLVNFHLETPSPSFFTWDDLKPKRTLAILYAQNRTFMDMNKGVRQESPRTVMVFPCPLDSFMDEFQGYISVEKKAKACFYCGKLETDDYKLLKCIRCKNVFYCGRNCQRPHWPKHKKLCQHAPMLANLSTLDFSRFDGFVDWSFPTVVPPTVEEKKEKATKAIRETLYSMGASTAIRGLMHSRVDVFLSLIEEKDTSSAVQLLCNESSPMMTMLNEGGLPQHIQDTFLFKSLKEFTCAAVANPDLRQYVVDLKAEGSGGYGSRSTHEFKSDALLSALFAAFPLWQHKECVGGISWSFESHYPLKIIEGSDAFKSNVWRMHGDNDSLLIKNRVSDTSVFMSDHMKLVAEIGVVIAQASPDNLVIRIIRVTANDSWSDCVRSIATQDNLPPNVYTLWIREDVALCGRFNPLDPAMSLVEQLLDKQEFSFEELLLGRLGINGQNFIRSDLSETEREVRVDEQACFSCGKLKTGDCFSNTQRRKYGNEARCKECVSLSTF